MAFNPTMKIGQTMKFESFYSGPQTIREIINDINFVIEDVKTKKQQNVHLWGMILRTFCPAQKFGRVLCS